MKRVFATLLAISAMTSFVIWPPATKYAASALPIVLHAQEQTTGCSLARAAGSYGVSDSGTIVGIGPIAIVSLATLDAGGTISGKSTLSENGDIGQRTLSGTYTVNRDCTGTVTFGEFDQSGNLLITLTADLVWDDNMSQFRFIVTSVVVPSGPSIPTVLSGDGRKLVP
jgi:hypothetical protein